MPIKPELDITKPSRTLKEDFKVPLSLPNGNESLPGSKVQLLYARYVNNHGNWLYEEVIKVGSLEVFITVRQGEYKYQPYPHCINYPLSQILVYATSLGANTSKTVKI